MFKDLCVFVAGAFVGVVLLLAINHILTLQAENRVYKQYIETTKALKSLDSQY